MNKILKKQNTVLKTADNKVLTIKPSDYVEIDPDLFLVEVSVEQNQVVTIPLKETVRRFVSRIEILDSSGNEIAVTIDYTGNISDCSFTTVAEEEYYIVLKNYSSSNSLQNVSITGELLTPTYSPNCTLINDNNPIVTELHSTEDSVIGQFTYKIKAKNAGTYTINISDVVLDPLNFNINWDYVGNTIPIVENITSSTDPRISFTYPTKGKYIIGISGNMSSFVTTDTSNITLLITRCLSWGNVGLQLISFEGCTALTFLPDQEGKLTDVLSFTNFCSGCTSLVTIPAGVFYNNILSTSFSNAFFKNTTLKYIPSTLFRDNIYAKYMDYVFKECEKIEYLPSRLFYNCTKVTTYSSCFFANNSITSIPVDLFYTSAMDGDYNELYTATFNKTFYNCLNLTTIPTGTFSSPQEDNLGKNVVKANDVSGIFAKCDQLTNLPEYLFHNQTSLVYGNAVFYSCNSLIEIPKGLFEGCTNLVKVGNYIFSGVRGVFSNCLNLEVIHQNCFKDCSSCVDFKHLCYHCPELHTIESGIFTNCSGGEEVNGKGTQSFESSFYDCYKLTEIPSDIFKDCIYAGVMQSTFQYTALYSGDPTWSGYQLDEDLFKYNLYIFDFDNTFDSCKNIKQLPERLFSYNTAVESFYSTFSSCSNLIELPPKLFRNNYNVTSFESTFSDCKSLNKIPIIIENNIEFGFFQFNPLVKNFSKVFSDCDLFNDYEGLTVTKWAIPQQTFWGNTEVYSEYAYERSGSFDRAFEWNYNLTEIPGKLFKNCTKATNFDFAFQYTGLIELPPDLFEGCQNIEGCKYTFSNTKISSIPYTLFNYCPRISNFKGCFQDNLNLTNISENLFDVPGSSVQDFSYCFTGCTSLTTIPTLLFDKNYNVINFSNCFKGCKSLVNVSNIFSISTNNSIVKDFSSCFEYCFSLETVGPQLFRHTKLALDFNRCFYGCPKLQQDPNMFFILGEEGSRFYNQPVDFGNTFYRDSNAGEQGIAPALWECNYGAYTPKTTDCWGGDGNNTTSLLNYNDIDNDWK